MKLPLISIVTPTFNRAHLLGETIESVLRQTYKHWELIIVDDGSVDRTTELVASFDEPRIRFHQFDHSGNFAVIRNRGLKLSQGELIAFLDSDDIWSPEKLSRVVEIFARHASSDFILNNIHLIGNTSVNSPELTEQHGVFFFLDLIHEKNIVFYPSALAFRKTVLDALHSLDEQLPLSADHDFILRMSSAFRGSLINDRLTSIRKHDSNSSSQGLVAIYSDTIAHVKRFYENGQLTKKDFAQLTARYNYKLGLILMRQRDKTSSGYFREAIKARPLWIKGWLRYLQSLSS